MDANLAWQGVGDVRAGLRVLETTPSLFRKSEAVVLLAMSPDSLTERPCTRGFTALLLGHSHGGQLNLPLVGATSAA